MVIAALISVFIYGYYLILYAPISTKVTQKSTQLIEKIQTLDWMKKVKNQKHPGKSKQILDNSQLLTILDSQLKDKKNLQFPYQLQQTGSGEVQLSFDEVPFQIFMGWLAKINDKYATNIKQLDVQNTATPGVTQLTLILSAGN